MSQLTCDTYLDLGVDVSVSILSLGISSASLSLKLTCIQEYDIILDGL